MPKFRKKLIVIEAHQWFKNGDHPDDIKCDYERELGKPEGDVVRYYRHPRIDGMETCGTCGVSKCSHGWVDTLEGGHIVCPGDWIITGVKGDYYPCKPDIFKETYEHCDNNGNEVVYCNCDKCTGIETE